MDRLQRVEERLVALRWQTGDITAFAEIVSRYESRLLLYLRKLLRSPEEAEDAMQEVWLDACRSIAKLRDCGAIRSWLYRLAHDRAARRLRERREPVRVIEDDEQIGVEGADEFAAEDARLVQAAMETLSHEHREALLLRFVEQMSYQQIADIARCGVGTVRSRLHYAKLAMRKAISEVWQ